MQVINFSNEQDIKIAENTEELIVSACSAVLSIENFSDDAEINVTLVDSEEIRRLNNDFRGIDKSTDVLSFPLGEDGIYDENPENGCLMLGDVIISVEQALAQADEFGHGVEREIAYLTVHSVLHLIGYDHIDEDDDREMRSKQRAIMKKLHLEV